WRRRGPSTPRPALPTAGWATTSAPPASAQPPNPSPPSRLRKNRVKRTRSLPQTCGEERQKPAGSAPVDATRRAADGPSPFHRSSRGLGQVADADQVVHRQAEDEHPAHATSAAVAGLA